MLKDVPSILIGLIEDHFDILGVDVHSYSFHLSDHFLFPASVFERKSAKFHKIDIRVKGRNLRGIKDGLRG